jgi:hypothetical protein
MACDPQSITNQYLEPQMINWGKTADNFLSGKKPMKSKKYTIRQ